MCVLRNKKFAGLICFCLNLREEPQIHKNGTYRYIQNHESIDISIVVKNKQQRNLVAIKLTKIQLIDL